MAVRLALKTASGLTGYCAVNLVGLSVSQSPLTELTPSPSRLGSSIITIVPIVFPVPTDLTPPRSRHVSGFFLSNPSDPTTRLDARRGEGDAHRANVSATEPEAVVAKTPPNVVVARWTT
jgi:hypothetical protein